MSPKKRRRPPSGGGGGSLDQNPLANLSFIEQAAILNPTFSLSILDPAPDVPILEADDGIDRVLRNGESAYHLINRVLADPYCAHVGLRQSWVDNQALWDILEDLTGLLRSTSGQAIQALANLGPAPTGLFQFDNSNADWANWGGNTPTSNPYLQCVFGLQYIRAIYNTPSEPLKYKIRDWDDNFTTKSKILMRVKKAMQAWADITPTAGNIYSHIGNPGATDTQITEALIDHSNLSISPGWTATDETHTTITNVINGSTINNVPLNNSSIFEKQIDPEFYDVDVPVDLNEVGTAQWTKDIQPTTTPINHNADGSTGGAGGDLGFNLTYINPFIDERLYNNSVTHTTLVTNNMSGTVQVTLRDFNDALNGSGLELPMQAIRIEPQSETPSGQWRIKKGTRFSHNIAWDANEARVQTQFDELYGVNHIQVAGPYLIPIDGPQTFPHARIFQIFFTNPVDWDLYNKPSIIEVDSALTDAQVLVLREPDYLVPSEPARDDSGKIVSFPAQRGIERIEVMPILQGGNHEFEICDYNDLGGPGITVGIKRWSPRRLARILENNYLADTVNGGKTADRFPWDVITASEAFLAFDTSDIPGSAVITSASLKVWLGQGGQMTDGFHNNGIQMRPNAYHTLPTYIKQVSHNGSGIATFVLAINSIYTFDNGDDASPPISTPPQINDTVIFRTIAKGGTTPGDISSPSPANNSLLSLEYDGRGTEPNGAYKVLTRTTNNADGYASFTAAILPNPVTGLYPSASLSGVGRFIDPKNAFPSGDEKTNISYQSQTAIVGLIHDSTDSPAWHLYGEGDIQNHGTVDFDINVRAIDATHWHNNLGPTYEATTNPFLPDVQWVTETQMNDMENRGEQGGIMPPPVWGTAMDATAMTPWRTPAQLSEIDIVAQLNTAEFGTNPEDHSAYTGLVDKFIHEYLGVGNPGNPGWYEFNILDTSYDWINKYGNTRLVLTSSQHDDMSNEPTNLKLESQNYVAPDSNWVQFGLKPNQNTEDTITIDASSGSWTISYDGGTPSPELAFDISPSDLEDVIESLDTWPKTEGLFDSPGGVAVDSLENVYVTDTYNNRVQKFDSEGNFILTWGRVGADDGRFNQPSGITIDADDNIYVVDANTSRVQKFDTNGTFLTKWGTFGSANGQFNTPMGITTDAVGNVYVADSGNHRIQKFTSSGVFISKFGSFGDTGAGFTVSASLNDTNNLTIAQFATVDADGIGVGHGFNVGDSVTITGMRNGPIDVFGRPSGSGPLIPAYGYNGTFLITAKTAQKFKVNLGVSGLPASNIPPIEGGIVKLTLGGKFNFPYDVAVDSTGKIYVADTMNNRIQEFDSSGNYLTQWSRWAAYYAEGANFIRKGIKVDPGGIGGGPHIDDEEEALSLNHPTSINVQTGTGGIRSYPHFDNDITICDSSHSRVIQFGTLKPDSNSNHWIMSEGGVGSYRTITRQGAPVEYTVPTPNTFHNLQGINYLVRPTGVAISPSGYIYIADTGNHRIEKWGPWPLPPIGTEPWNGTSADGYGKSGVDFRSPVRWHNRIGTGNLPPRLVRGPTGIIIEKKPQHWAQTKTVRVTGGPGDAGGNDPYVITFNRHRTFVPKPCQDIYFDKFDVLNGTAHSDEIGIVALPGYDTEFYRWELQDDRVLEAQSGISDPLIGTITTSRGESNENQWNITPRHGYLFSHHPFTFPSGLSDDNASLQHYNLMYTPTLGMTPKEDYWDPNYAELTVEYTVSSTTKVVKKFKL